MAKSWYAFGGGDNYNDITNYYSMRDAKAQCLCGNEICVIYTEDNGTHPKEPLSINIQQYIKLALATQQIQPDHPYDAKKYVYLRLKN